MDEAWNWEVRQLSDVDFSLVFPSASSLCMAIRGGGLTLPISKARALVVEGARDDLATEVLSEVWVKLHGVPPPFRNTNRLRIGARPVGRPMMVDEATFDNPKLPIRMQFGCKAGAKVADSCLLTVNGQGYKIHVEVEKEPGGGGAGPSPPPPSDRRKDKDAEDFSEDEDNRWRGKRGRRASHVLSPAAASGSKHASGA